MELLGCTGMNWMEDDFEEDGPTTRKRTNKFERSALSSEKSRQATQEKRSKLTQNKRSRKTSHDDGDEDEDDDDDDDDEDEDEDEDVQASIRNRGGKTTPFSTKLVLCRENPLLN
jgi:hypothetical protein